MQAFEAMTHLIKLSDDAVREQGVLIVSVGTELEDLAVASAVCQMMLNTALPLARFRAFVEFEKDQPKRSKFEESVAPKEEFTVCAVTMSGILSGLLSVTHVRSNVRVTVWEQRQTGADMISGFQGETKSTQYKLFLKSLPALETMPTVQ